MTKIDKIFQQLKKRDKEIEMQTRLICMRISSNKKYSQKVRELAKGILHDINSVYTRN
jgi:hypothetical protein